MSSYTRDLILYEAALKSGKAHMLLPDSDLDLLIAALSELVPEGSRGLEIGTFVGQTSVILAELGYQIVTIEQDPSYADIAKSRVEQLGLSDKIEVLQGVANSILTSQAIDFWRSLKFIFIDANKGGYLGYYEHFLAQVDLNNVVLIFDNVFLNGQIRNEVGQIFSEPQPNALNLSCQFAKGLPKDGSSMEAVVKSSKEKGPAWSNSVRSQMVTLCQRVRRECRGILLDSSDGMLVGQIFR